MTKAAIPLIGLAFLLLSSCTRVLDPFPSEDPDLSRPYAIAASEAAAASRLTVKIDAAYEAYDSLLYAMGLTYMLVNDVDTPNYAYYADIKAYFTKYRSDPLVDRAKRLMGRLPVDMAPCVIAMLDGQMAIKVDYSFPDALKGYMDERSLGFFVEILRDYCALTDFNSFYEAHRSFYKTVLRAYREGIAGRDMLADAESYVGLKKGAYEFILEPMQRGGNFSGMPVFFDESALVTIYHEMAHSLCNALVDKHWSDF